MQNISTTLIRTFLTLAKTNSTTKTADIMGRSQPAISLQMQKLESLLNIKLFDRNLKSMQLTNDGKILLPLAKKMIEANDDIVNKMLESSPYKTIAVGIPNDISQYLWKKCISDFMGKNPNITLEITNDVSDSLIALYDKKALDVIIVTTEDIINNTVYNTTRPVSIYSKNKENFDADVIKIITAPSGCVYRQVITKTLQAIDKKYNFSIICNSVSSTRQAVLNNDGITISLESIRNHIFQGEEIYIAPYHTDDIYISVLKNSEDNTLIDAFIKATIPYLKSI